MERAFQTAMFIHNPEVVFVLGDLLDEGKWASDEEFFQHVARFRRMFRTTRGAGQVQVVVGNHDIGFHYDVTRHKYQRFRSAWTAPSVRRFSLQVRSVCCWLGSCFVCTRFLFHFRGGRRNSYASSNLVTENLKSVLIW